MLILKARIIIKSVFCKFPSIFVRWIRIDGIFNDWLAVIVRLFLYHNSRRRYVLFFTRPLGIVLTYSLQVNWIVKVYIWLNKFLILMWERILLIQDDNDTLLIVTRYSSHILFLLHFFLLLILLLLLLLLNLHIFILILTKIYLHSGACLFFIFNFLILWMDYYLAQFEILFTILSTLITLLVIILLSFDVRFLSLYNILPFHLFLRNVGGYIFFLCWTKFLIILLYKLVLKACNNLWW